MKRQRWKTTEKEQSLQAVIGQRGNFYCQRCGNSEQRLFYQYDCEACQKKCWYCRECVSFGMMTTCTMIEVDQSEFECEKLTTVWSGQLSKQQAEASSLVQQWICNQQTGMIYAVCGAGKTEMMFAGIATALKNNQRVCWATPRSDVVKELHPRLESAFPGISIASHYQNSEFGKIDAQLVVATTHQLVRYYQAFECIIIDEVDAFPYTVDKKLTRFAQRACKPNGNFIYLTATPSKQLRKTLVKQNQPIFQLPGRYHRRPLPVPQVKFWGSSIKIMKKTQKRTALFSKIDEFLEINRVVMVFVPTIQIGASIYAVFAEYYQQQCAFVYSSDSERKQKVDKFRQREIKVLLTTTILERGVTIDWCEVIILDADHDVFDWAALVQMSGRVDRKTADEQATVWFIAQTQTLAMKTAIKEIKACNQLASERGILL
ncbi:MAG: DEAD/DEAH box helicase [Culicoidibacterales bacterium]